MWSYSDCVDFIQTKECRVLMNNTLFVLSRHSYPAHIVLNTCAHTSQSNMSTWAASVPTKRNWLCRTAGSKFIWYRLLSTQLTHTIVLKTDPERLSSAMSNARFFLLGWALNSHVVYCAPPDSSRPVTAVHFDAFEPKKKKTKKPEGVRLWRRKFGTVPFPIPF